MDSPLLSKEDNKRISLLRAESMKAGAIITPADMAWICETIKKLAHCGPDDYLFPERLALFNPITQLAFAMRYGETLLLEQSFKFRGPFLGANLFHHQTSIQPPEAVMLIRPYIKIVPPADPAAVLSLRGSTLQMEVDGEKVLRTPIDEHLILEDGSFQRKNRWQFRPSHQGCLYRACPLVDGNAHVDTTWGIGCQNGTVIAVSLFPDQPFQGEITLVTGLVAARYRADGSVRPSGVIP